MTNNVFSCFESNIFEWIQNAADASLYFMKVISVLTTKLQSLIVSE